MNDTVSCATCHAPATILYTARGGLTYTYRAAAACPQHQREIRGWVARAGPPVTETPTQTTAENAGLLF